MEAGRRLCASSQLLEHYGGDLPLWLAPTQVISVEMPAETSVEMSVEMSVEIPAAVARTDTAAPAAGAPRRSALLPRGGGAGPPGVPSPRHDDRDRNNLD
jgi:hypothetical protein